mmetsp:Transcript_10798/g.16057  ORF Transcript_10798/g.16057 Transcript_10798/m.16057 type:complete len:109 (-) Transcript_10798:220-546(-)
MADDQELKEPLIESKEKSESEGAVEDIRVSAAGEATIVNANDELGGPSCFETCYTSIAVIACCPIAAAFRCVMCPFVSGSVLCCERNQAVSVSYTRISREAGTQIILL